MVTDITHYHDLKIRSAGADTFVEVCIHVNPGLSINEAHNISHQVSDEIRKKVDRAYVHIHTEPESTGDFSKTINHK